MRKRLYCMLLVLSDFLDMLPKVLVLEEEGVQ